MTTARTACRIACDVGRACWTAALVACDHVARVDVADGAAIVETREIDRCYDDIAAAVRTERLVVSSLGTLDSDLGAVLDLLARGSPA